MLILIVSEILTSKNVDIENVGQRHGLQHVQWCDSMQMSTSIKVIARIFFNSSFH